MSDPIDGPERLFRVELDGNTVVYAEMEQPAIPGALVGMVTVQMPAARAHSLAHLVYDCGPTLRPASDRAEKPSWPLLGRSLESVAVALGEPAALACAARLSGSVPQEQRIAAVGVLRASEPALSPVERIAVVDAAARWLEEDAGDELALALLRAACSSPVNANRVYVELLTPASGGEDGA
jgi:hypothetical protein